LKLCRTHASILRIKLTGGYFQSDAFASQILISASSQMGKFPFDFRKF